MATTRTLAARKQLRQKNISKLFDTLPKEVQQALHHEAHRLTDDLSKKKKEEDDHGT